MIEFIFTVCDLWMARRHHQEALFEKAKQWHEMAHMTERICLIAKRW